MRKKPILSSGANEMNISLTAYRSLLVLGLLMEKPMSRDEIANVFKCNHITSKSFSLDTVRVTINTLKAAGCVISRPTCKNEYKYVLLSHPFRIEISDEQIDCLNQIRKNLSQIGDWQLVLSINDFYNNVVAKTQNESKIELIKNAELLIEIDKTVLKTLSAKSIKNKELIVKYDSPEFGEEELKIIADKIFYEEGKLYLWCYSHKYDSFSYLRVDKIKEVSVVSIASKAIKREEYTVVYKIKGDSFQIFKPEPTERIIERNGSYLVIEALVYNEFKLIQRLLSFGADFYLISPDSLKSKIISKLKTIKQGYVL